MRYIRRPIRSLAAALLLAAFLCVPAMAASGDVAGAVEQTWQDAATQIKTVVDNVVFPALTMVLAVAFSSRWASPTSNTTSTAGNLNGAVP